MNNAMDQIRERNLDISEFSESTQVGVSSLKASMRDVAESLSQFKIEGEGTADLGIAPVDELKQAPGATQILREDEMQALEQADEEVQASV